MNRRSFLQVGAPATVGAAMTSSHVRAQGVTNSGALINAADYGASGDGRADDTAPLQRALDALKDEGCLYIPAGQYRITRSLVCQSHDRIRITGDGQGTVLLADADMQDLLRLKRPFNGSLIEQMTFDANGRAETALRVEGGVYANMDRLDILSPRDKGIHCGVTDPGVKSGVECMITNSRLTGMRQDSLEDHGSQKGIVIERYWTDNHLNNLIVRGFVDTGMELMGNSCLLHEVHIYRAPCFQFKHALRVDANKIFVVQSYFDNFTHTGVELLGEHAVLQTCYFLRWDAAFGAGPVYPGVCVVVGSPDKVAKYTSIIGNGFVSYFTDPRYNSALPMTSVKVVNAEKIRSFGHTYEGAIPGETEANGSVHINVGVQEQIVEHHMIIPPANVQLTPAGPTEGAEYWVDDIDDRRFVIRVKKPPSRELEFYWKAEA